MVITRSRSITQTPSPPKRPHSRSPSPTSTKRLRRTRKRSQDHRPQPSRPSMISRMKTRFSSKKPSDPVPSSSNDILPLSQDFAHPAGAFELEYPDPAEEARDNMATVADFYTDDIIMDTEAVGSDSDQAEKIGENMLEDDEEESDKDEADVLSYLSDSEVGGTASHSASAEPQVEFTLGRGVSLDRTRSITDHEHQHHGRIGSITPTASVPDLDDGGALLHVPNSSRGTSVAPTGYSGLSMNTEGMLGGTEATSATSRTAVHVDTAMAHGQTSQTLTVTDSTTAVDEIYHTARLMTDSPSQTPLARSVEPPRVTSKPSVEGSSGNTTNQPNEGSSRASPSGGSATSVDTTHEDHPEGHAQFHEAFAGPSTQQHVASGNNADDDQQLPESPRDDDVPLQAPEDADNDQQLPESPRDDEVPLQAPEDADDNIADTDSEALERDPSAHEKKLRDLDAIARTQLRLIEDISRETNRAPAQDRNRLISLEHAVRHRTILSQRAVRLSKRYELLQDRLSRRECDVFELAVLQLETDTCTETLRALALNMLLQPAMFTTETPLQREVASDLRRMQRETIALIRSENFVELW